jgi:hypothetical protein
VWHAYYIKTIKNKTIGTIWKIDKLK